MSQALIQQMQELLERLCPGLTDVEPLALAALLAANVDEHGGAQPANATPATRRASPSVSGRYAAVVCPSGSARPKC